jgi:negative regulator of sigma E activity
MTDDLRPDPEVARLLRAAGVEPPLDLVDWERLHAAIVSRVRRSIATVTWWEQAARWSRALVPLAAAASVMLAIALARQMRVERVNTLAEAPTLETTVVSGNGSREMMPALIGPSSADDLLQAVVSP